VEVRGLRSRTWWRRGAPAVNGIDLSVPVGARLLVMSRPEPAASLLLRILAGLVRPAAGRIWMAGMPGPRGSPHGWLRRVAYLGPGSGAHDWLTPIEALLLAARLAGLERDEAERRVDELVERVRLGADAVRPLRRGGPAAQQRTAFAAALVGDPEVLLLDEPLRAVDPAERRELLTLPGARVTLLLASRYPASEEGIVNQVALIRDGRVAVHAAAEDLTAARLPLNVRGIEALADGRVAARIEAAAAASGRR
jgi:ABC-2 type transport system ATP-binding protein